MNSFRKNMIIPVAGFCVVLFLAGCTPGKAQTRGNDYNGSFQNEEFETFDPGNSNWDDRIPPYDRAQKGSDDQRYSNTRNNSGEYKNDRSSYNNSDSQVSRNSYSDSPVRSDFQQNPYGAGNDVRGGFVRGSGVESNEFREDRFFQKGPASWYGREFHGKTTASGERFDMNNLTAAHKTLPFGSIVEVRNLENGRSVRLKINDRGPYRGNRIIDVSFEAARALDMVKSGEANVGINVIHMGDNSTAHQNNAGSSYVEPVSDRGLPLNVNRYDSGSRYDSVQGYSSDFKLQAGAFYSRRNAENLRDRIQSITDMPVKVVQDGDFYKVRVEGLRSKHEAERVKNSLYNSNISSFVVE